MAEDNLEPARMGATEVKHYLYKGMVARRGVADDGTPVGYPLDFGDFGLPVIRFDALDDGQPIAALINWGMHPEGLEADDLITAEFLAPLERFIERATGAPLVFGQGDVGSSESGPARPYHPDWPRGVFRQWDNAGHAQVERGAYLLAQDVIRAWNEIGAGNGLVPFSSDFDVAAGNAWIPGPLSHPYPSVSNCRTRPTATGNPGAPIVGLPDCERGNPPNPVSAQTAMVWDSLRAHGIPIPMHYDAPAFTAVEENLRLHLQAFKLGEVILMSCACEAQVDLILNLESRTNETQEDLWLGYDWEKRLACTQNADTSWTCVRKANDTPDGADHDVAPGSTFFNPLNFSDAAMKRMKAQVYNDADGWNLPENVVAANSEPTNPDEIWGNFTHSELSEGEGYKLPIGVGHAGDYNGYTVSYREYMSYDHYRKALTSYGPHTADYMNTILMELARELNSNETDHLYDMNEEETAREAADEARQVAFTTALGQASSQLYDAWQTALPDDVGPAEGIEGGQPRDLKRFDSTTFSWRGGSNAVDNPVVRVERLVGDEWDLFADQSGEIQTKLAFPQGANGLAQTYAGDQEWIWTANFEAFNSFPAGIGSTPAGTYRFVVEGLIRQEGTDTSYEIVSDGFAVAPWDGVQVLSLQVTDGTASFTATSDYPDIDEEPVFDRYVKQHIRTERGTGDEIKPGDQKSWCDTCSFRPWAAGARIASAQITVVGSDGTHMKVPAQCTTPPGPETPNVPVVHTCSAVTAVTAGGSVVIVPGDVVDAYGETTTGCVGPGGDVECPVPTEPTETPTPTPTPTTETPTLAFTDTSATEGQHSDDVELSARLTDSDGDPIPDADIRFELAGADGSRVVGATTDEAGVASVTTTLSERPGSYYLTARYAGQPGRYEGAAEPIAFLVTRDDSLTALTSEGNGQNKMLRATLVDEDSGVGLAGRTIQFFNDKGSLGTAITDADGVATFTPGARQSSGRRTFRAVFDGDDFYGRSEGETN
jgi:hypothetical protein